MQVLLHSAPIRQSFEEFGVFIGSVCNTLTMGTADEERRLKIKYVLRLVDHPDSSK
jgi:hypothetical protein